LKSIAPSPGSAAGFRKPYADFGSALSGVFGTPLPAHQQAFHAALIKLRPLPTESIWRNLG